MKYPPPKTIIECAAWNCTFFDEIELEEVLSYFIGRDSMWVMPDDWDEGWTVNEDGENICPNHEPEAEETLSAAERNPDLCN